MERCMESSMHNMKILQSENPRVPNTGIKPPSIQQYPVLLALSRNEPSIPRGERSQPATGI